jgi:lysophospholipase L1-like esterase
MPNTNPETTRPPNPILLTLSGLIMAGAVLIYFVVNPGFSLPRLLFLLVGAGLAFLGVWLAKQLPTLPSGAQQLAQTLLGIYEKAFLVLAAIGATFLAAELAYRLLIRAYGPEIRNNLTGKPFVLDSQAIYRDAPFDYEAYLQFVGENYHNVYVQKEDYYISTDFDSEMFNVSGGFRETTSQPEDFQAEIFIFGGSTVFSIETPDAYTIPSFLQSMLNEAGMGHYRVVSRGIPGGYSEEELAALLETDIQPGDIVIFYDGINEIFRYLMDRSPKQYDNLIYYMKKSLLLNDFLIPRLPLKRFEDPESYQKEIYQIYSQNLTRAEEYVRQNGGTFVHILQPSLYTTPNLSQREKNLLENLRVLYPGWIEAYHLGYQAATRAHEDLVARGIPSIDFQQTLDGEDRTVEIFIDDLHLNHAGNKIIAARIMDALQHRGLLESNP